MSSTLTDLLRRARTKGLTMESDGTQGDPAGVPTTSDAPGNNLTPVKEKKTAEELAAMIRQDLSEVDGCPKRGMNVTVYGLNPMEFDADVWRRRRSRPQ